MKYFLKAAAFALVLCVCLLGLDRALRREDGGAKYDAFFEEKQDFDVFFLGTSHMMDSVFPMELWRDYGIASYNLANPAETLEATYWTLRLAPEHHTPRVVVVDVCYLGKAQSEVTTRRMGHLFMDEIPLSALKLQAIWSLYPEGERAEFVFPLVTYHTRWEELFEGSEPMTDAQPITRGAELRVGRSAPGPYARTTDMDARDTAGKQALYRLIELCRERGIEVVLTAIPYPADEATQKMMNSAQLIAEETGVPFLNLFDIEGLVDFATDCYDEASHLNPDGGAKVTRYLGEYLSEEYGFENRRNDPAYAHWEKDLAAYEALVKAQWGPYRQE